MAQVKAWKLGDPKAPLFPDNFEVTDKAVLQVTDIKSNHNKYYAIEVHTAQLKGKDVFRVFTHYGRTDDLESDPDAGQKEHRFYATLAEAQQSYEAIYRAKTSPSKGYKEVSLASSRIGSSKARGTSSGHIDDATIQKAGAQKAATAPETTKTPLDAEATKPPPDAAAEPPREPPAEPAPPAPALPPSWRRKLMRLVGLDGPQATAISETREIPPPPDTSATPLHPRVAELVDYIYAEATSALTSTVAVKITAAGIETPLGILTLGQIEKGETILQELYELFQEKTKKRDRLEQLSGEFYTVIPHRIGRTRVAVAAAVIDSLEAFEQKQETLQLMKDMLQVNGEGNVLYHSQTHAQYQALRCDIGWVEPGSTTFRQIRDLVINSQVKSKSIKVVRVYTLRRAPEWRAFTDKVGNQRQLFHGSRIRNWVGILSRGIVLPKIAVSLGVNRTDAGWLGNGIYFGDAACTSVFYTSPGRKKTRLMAVARVALGRVRDYYKITYGLAGPPSGYDSCHGVRNAAGRRSQFADDEYVIYDSSQQKLEYLVELTA
jgi:hypothetical protein